MVKSKEFKAFEEKYQRFTWSSPFGYDFEDVERAISDYDKTILEAKSIIEQKKDEVASKNEEISRLQEELTRIQIQLQELQIPVAETSPEDPIEVLNNFAGMDAFSKEDEEENETENSLEEEKPQKRNLPPIIGG